jgi:glycosyltransferase involved in cell wall biosynthesis
MTEWPIPLEDQSPRSVGTDAWRLNVPQTVTAASPLLVVPTVHPRGDRRIVRCAQVALDEGFRVHFIWLGEGEASSNALVSETVLPSPPNARERISMVRTVARIAAEKPAALWHIHDYYMLSEAKRWSRKVRRPVLYDVHEYYASYYSEKLPLPRFARRVAAAAIERYQVRAAKSLGAANVVTEMMAEPFRSAGVPVAVSPNYPMLAQFQGLPSTAFEARRWSVLHIGTLSREYGTELLVALAARSAERGLRFEFHIVSRFPSRDHEVDFRRLLDAASHPSNIVMLDARPTHEMPALLARMGFGLSLLMPDGQNESAIPSKNYEHAMAGLVNVVTMRKAQRAFSEMNAVTVSGDAGSVDAILDGMLRLAENPVETDADLRAKSAAAKESFTWERGVAPALAAQMRSLGIRLGTGRGAQR